MDLESMIRAQRIMCLKKYIDDYTSAWKSFLSYYLEKVGGKFILQCHFDCRNLPIFMPGFYKDCLDAWSSLTRQEVYSYEDIMNQVVWNNRYILSEGKSLHYPFFHNICGISKVGDLVSRDNIFLGSEKVLNAKLTPSQYFLLMGVVSAIPNEWRSIIKGRRVHVDPHPFFENSFRVRIRGEMFDLSSVSSKTLYREFRSRKVIPPTAQAKFKEEYSSLSVDWKEIYSLAFNVTLDTNLRAFQYKLLNRIIFTNDKFFKFKLVDSPSCTFCKTNEESLEHLLFFCKITEFFWKEVLSCLAILNNEIVDFSLIDVLFGKFDIDEDFIVINHILFYIYRSKLDKTKPSLEVFKAKLKAIFNIEFLIAKRNGKLAQHYKKWDSFISVLV